VVDARGILLTDNKNFKKEGTMIDKAEDRVSRFYNSIGWKTEGDVTEDAKRFEDLRTCAHDYVSKCRLRVSEHIPDHGINMLDMASGPIQYIEYLDYSKNFQKRYCIDLSSEALEGAKRKIGDHGVFLHGSFFDILLEEEFFDCVVSLHTLYHIDKSRQEDAVRKLVRVTKQGKPVIIVYSNPNNIISRFARSLPISTLRKVIKILKDVLNKREKKISSNMELEPILYFHPHAIEWWERFNDIAYIKILPWRSLTSENQKRLIPNNRLGNIMFRLLFILEQRFPEFFIKHGAYPMIILTKK